MLYSAAGTEFFYGLLKKPFMKFKGNLNHMLHTQEYRTLLIITFQLFDNFSPAYLKAVYEI